MELTQLIVLAVYHSLSEVWPLGAAGHHSLTSQILDWPPPGASLLLAVRIGLLLGVMAYLWRDLADIAVGVARAAKGKRNTDAALALQLLVAAVPTLGLGFAYTVYAPTDWQTAQVMGWSIVGGALVLWFFDRMSMTVKRVEHATYVDALVISLAQVIALVPGLGSAAVGFTLARMLGYERNNATRLYFLLSIPVSIVVIARDAYTLATSGGEITNSEILGGIVAFFTALIGFAILQAWLRRATFTPFIIYRLLLGAALLALAYDVITP